MKPKISDSLLEEILVKFSIKKELFYDKSDDEINEYIVTFFRHDHRINNDRLIVIDDLITQYDNLKLVYYKNCCSILKARILFQLSEFDIAYQSTLELKEYFIEIPNCKFTSMCFFNLVEYYSVNNLYHLALQEALEFEKYLRQSETHYILIVDVNGLLGNIYLRLGEYDNALFYFKKVIDTYQKNGKTVEPIAFNNVASCYIDRFESSSVFKEDLTQAKKYLELGFKSINVFKDGLEGNKPEEFRFIYDACYMHLNMGIIAYMELDLPLLKKHKRLLFRLLKGYEYSDFFQLKNKAIAADVFYLEKKYDKAEKVFKNIISKYLKTGNESECIYLYKKLIHINLALNNAEQVAKNYDLMMSAIKKIVETKEKNQTNALKVIHNVEAIEYEKKLVEEKNIIIEMERKKSDDLLLNILPFEIATELKETSKVTAKLYTEVSVFFCDITGFTQTSALLSPAALIKELDEIFIAFDAIIGKYNIEKIKTIGDSYMCAAGLPDANPNHAIEMTLAALEMLDYMRKRQQNTSDAPNSKWAIRAGIHSGEVIAGVVGKTKFAFDIWGDTVNIASRMESHGASGKLNISEATFNLIKHEFVCEGRGKLSVKGKGELEMYFVNEPIQ